MTTKLASQPYCLVPAGQEDWNEFNKIHAKHVDEPFPLYRVYAVDEEHNRQEKGGFYGMCRQPVNSQHTVPTDRNVYPGGIIPTTEHDGIIYYRGHSVLDQAYLASSSAINSDVVLCGKASVQGRVIILNGSHVSDQVRVNGRLTIDNSTISGKCQINVKDNAVSCIDDSVLAGSVSFCEAAMIQNSALDGHMRFQNVHVEDSEIYCDLVENHFTCFEDCYISEHVRLPSHQSLRTLKQVRLEACQDFLLMQPGYPLDPELYGGRETCLTNDVVYSDPLIGIFLVCRSNEHGKITLVTRHGCYDSAQALAHAYFNNKIVRMSMPFARDERTRSIISRLYARLNIAFTALMGDRDHCPELENRTVESALNVEYDFL